MNITTVVLIASLILFSSRQACSQDEQNGAMGRITIKDDGTQFLIGDSGTVFRVWGVNYDHDAQGRLLEDYWKDEWSTIEQDFEEIRNLGANVVRVHLQLGKFMRTADQYDEPSFERLSRLIDLAESKRLYLDITGLGCYHKTDVPEWYDGLSETQRWQVQARFWKRVAKTCRDSSAIFCFDLMNEPILSGRTTEHEWLAGEFGGKHFVQRISLDLAGRTRETVAAEWVKLLFKAIREEDPAHLITVGVIPWTMVFPNAKPVFYLPETASQLDFVSIHLYPKTGELERASEAIQAYRIPGKPLVVEEIFPLSASIEEVVKFIDESDRQTNGWVSFYWGKTVEEYGQEKDLQSAVIAAWLTKFTELSAAYARPH